jgi:hypothetical protein
LAADLLAIGGSVATISIELEGDTPVRAATLGICAALVGVIAES